MQQSYESKSIDKMEYESKDRTKDKAESGQSKVKLATINLDSDARPASNRYGNSSQSNSQLRLKKDKYDEYYRDSLHSSKS